MDYQPFDWDEYNRKKVLEEEKYAKVSAEIKETMEQSEQVIKSCNKSMHDINESIKGAQQACQGIDDFQKKFSDIMQSMALKIAQSFSLRDFRASEQEPKTAQLVSIDEAKSKIQGNVCILSGAGLSVASGIRTFRGEGGFWNNIECKEVLTYEYFQKKNKSCWQWHQEFQQMVKGKVPNQGHKSIVAYKRKFPDTLLVTQNIDNLLTEELNSMQVKFGFFKDIYEIHGNIKFMRCDKDCEQKLYQMPDLKETPQPKCPKCKQKARPHILFFDESYQEKYNRTDSLKEELKNVQTIISVGTMLETSYAKNIILDAIEKKLTIIEVNPEPIIELGNTYTLAGPSEEILPQLLSLI